MLVERFLAAKRRLVYWRVSWGLVVLLESLRTAVDTEDHMSVSRDLQRGYGRFHDSANFVLVEMLVHTLLRLDQIRPYKLSLH